MWGRASSASSGPRAGDGSCRAPEPGSGYWKKDVEGGFIALLSLIQGDDTRCLLAIELFAAVGQGDFLEPSGDRRGGIGEGIRLALA